MVVDELVSAVAEPDAEAPTRRRHPGVAELERALRAVLGDSDAVGDGEFARPALPYEEKALVPFYHPDVLRNHYHGYHAQCVRLLNMLCEGVSAGRWTTHGRLSKAVSRTLYVYGSDHALHCLFWNSIRPGGSPIPAGLAEAMERDFGSIAAAQFYFAAVCRAIRHRGWGVIGYDAGHNKLVMFATGETVNLTAWPVAPVLVCDMWEHAYRPQYGTHRDRWVDGFLRMVDWEFVAARHQALIMATLPE